MGQHCSPDTLEPSRITQKINFDGIPNDSVWKMACHITKFTQTDPDFGKPSSERTEVAVLYDHDMLYFGIWCYQKDAHKITAKYMQRDFDYSSDDCFKISFSPFNDGRTGYLFVVNVNGARADEQVSATGSNGDWNGVWDAKAIRTDSGWFAEVEIPFNTLQFKKDSVQTWALNFVRFINANNEYSSWQGWGRDYSIYNYTVAGTITGIKNTGYSKRFELKPYILGGVEQDAGSNASSITKVGGDLNIDLTPTLKMNLTVNTDFAQVEADQIQVNLTRFNLYYPEKREFFLEGSNNFEMNMGNGNSIFYTRQIGIQDLQTVPVIGGVRVFGSEGKSNIGFLSIETGQLDTIKATNNTVFRYTYNVGKQSDIGFILTSKISNNTSNQVLGIDARYTTSTLFKNKNLNLYGSMAQSIDNYTTQPNSLAYRVYLEYPNDVMYHFIQVSSSPQNFNPELGFLYRTDYTEGTWVFNYNPRFTNLGMKQLLFIPWSFNYYIAQSTGQVQSWDNISRPFGFTLKSGDAMAINLFQSYDHPTSDFSLTPTAIIPAGEYTMYRNGIGIASYTGRKVWASFGYIAGTFYTGTIKNLTSTVGINFSKHLNMVADYNYNYIILPNGPVISNQADATIAYAFTTKIDLSLFGQYSSLSDLLLFNFRLHWIPKIGTDLYFVFDQGYNQVNALNTLKPQTTSGVAKFIYRITF